MSKKTIIVYVIAALIVLVAVLMFILSNIKPSNPKEEPVAKENVVLTESQQKEKELEELKDMGESQRIHFYISKYMKFIEDKEYEKAYNLLYSEFKSTYFSSLETYIAYVKEKYPVIIGITYTNLQREGYYYIETLQIQDLLNEAKNFKQMIVIKENGLGDFVLSFQV